MPTNGGRRRPATSRVPAGVVIGVATGFLIDLFGVFGLALFLTSWVVSAFVPPRFTLLGAVLVGAGVLWLPFATEASVRCAANPSSCSHTSPIPFAIAAAVILTAGVLT